MSVDEFIRASAARTIRTDVLHLSPTCQYFSPAHTQQYDSQRDDSNIFALFGCRELINKIRPRIVTLEQTFGITHGKHFHYFRALIGDVTQLGYSLRWKIVRLCTWGSAQDRKRLIMIAAGPGERLPDFPKPTHSKCGDYRAGIKKFTTIRQAISRVRVGDNLHNLHDCTRSCMRWQPYNAERLAKTVTTGGSNSHHPNGRRDFTLREQACLQGFPKKHVFHGVRTEIKRQIGNAFPPNTVQVLYKHIREWLAKEDGLIPHRSLPEEVFVIDDDTSASAPQTRDSVSGSPSAMGHQDYLMSSELMLDHHEIRQSCIVDLTLD